MSHTLPSNGRSLPKRRCRYCKALFQPARKSEVFCQPNHRKDFWRYGGLPFDKMMVRVEKETRRIAREEFAAIIREQAQESQ